MQPKPLRVCHVIHALGPGGAERLLVDLAGAAPSFRMKLSVVSLMPIQGLAYPRQLRKLGVEVRSLDLATRWDPRGLARVVGAVREADADVVHSHLKHADLLGALAARRLHLPMVSTLHLIEGVSGPLGLAKRWVAAGARRSTASCTIAVSESARNWYLETFPVDPTGVITVPNGVCPPRPLPPKRRAELRATLGVPPGAVMTTMVAIMRPNKGHAQLIEAAANVSAPVDMRFVLAGDGPLRASLEAAARDRRLARRRVIFAGFCSDVDELLAASDLMVHPSLADALPTALIHGLAAGLPAVASHVGGIPEVVTPETARLVPPGDVEALASALCDLALDPDTRARMGRAARLRYHEQFHVEVWARRLRQVYDDVLAAADVTSRSR